MGETITRARIDILTEADEYTRQGKTAAIEARRHHGRAVAALRRGNHRMFEQFASRELAAADRANSLYATARRLIAEIEG